MEETLQQLTKLKKAAFLANGNFMKKNSQFEELKKELQTTKGVYLKNKSFSRESKKKKTTVSEKGKL